MSETTIDRATFEALQQTAGAEFVGELVDTFLSEAPLMQQDLRAALAAGDADRFRRAAHSLKSNSLTFGAHPARRHGPGPGVGRSRPRSRSQRAAAGRAGARVHAASPPH